MNPSVTMNPGNRSKTERQDTDKAADARVLLKIAASGYHASRHGENSADLIAVAIDVMVARAFLFYGQMTSTRLDPDVLRAGATIGSSNDPDLKMSLAKLLVGASAYETTRHGADACVEFTRAAIGALCQNAVELVEAVIRKTHRSERRQEDIPALTRGDHGRTQ